MTFLLCPDGGRFSINLPFRTPLERLVFTIVIDGTDTIFVPMFRNAPALYERNLYYYGKESDIARNVVLKKPMSSTRMDTADTPGVKHSLDTYQTRGPRAFFPLDSSTTTCEVAPIVRHALDSDAALEIMGEQLLMLKKELVRFIQSPEFDAATGPNPSYATKVSQPATTQSSIS